MAPRRFVVVVLLWALCTACSTREVRLDMGQGQPLIHVPRTGDAKPVELGKEEFIKALAKEARRIRPSFNPERTAHWTSRSRLRSGPRWLRK